MVEIERRIYLSEDLYKSEYSYFYGKNKDVIVKICYYNVKFDRVTERSYLNYRDSLNLVKRKELDKRYKNFEFWITL